MNDMFMYRLGQKRGGGSGGGGGGSSGGDNFPIGDGNTHIWISLPEGGRKSPVLGVGVNGTVTVDWGDGSEPDTLTGTSASTVQYTPVHEYEKSGDYHITLSGNEIGFCLQGNGNSWITDEKHILNYDYRNRVKKVELGSHVTYMNNGTFYEFGGLESVYITNPTAAVNFMQFRGCFSLTDVFLPDELHANFNSFFYECKLLSNVRMPSVTTAIESECCRGCICFVGMRVPSGVTRVGSKAFMGDRSLAYLDFSQHESVPAMDSTDVFSGAAVGFEIRVPAALVDEWKAATNWATYADKIVGV